MSLDNLNDFHVCRHITITGIIEIVSRIATMLEKLVFADRLANN